MPYVNKVIRRQTRAPLETLIAYVRQQEPDKQDGVLNYLVSELVACSVRPATGWRYNTLHRAYGVFMSAGAEFYRRLVTPYEDTAIKTNGDTIGYAVRPQEKAGCGPAHDARVAL